MSSIEYLEEERKKIWSKLIELEDLIEKKTPECESDAKQASKKASEYRNKCETTKNDALQILDETKKLKEDIHISSINATEAINKIKDISDKSLAILNEIQTKYNILTPKYETIKSHITALDEIFKNYESFVEKMNKLDNIYTSSDDLSSKIKANYNQMINQKKEIEQLYYQIFGYVNKDQKDGADNIISGLKEKLENAYTKLEVSATVLQTQLTEIEKNSASNFESFSKTKDQQFNANTQMWTTEYNSMVKKIESLLPDAMTAGLSHAYSKKKSDETADCIKIEKNFTHAVIGMIGVSLIPFCVSVYLIYNGVSIEDAILKMPRLVLSILPLYIPVLWLAYSANLKMKLSKRLIEEYTHKEVLSKTFEGLSKQIQNIENAEISKDLQTRLLYNILEVSSENPGKLISDYNKSDHPLMDALDKSVQLANAIDKLSKLPGLSKLTSYLEQKSKHLIEDKSEKANAGIDIVAEKTHTSE